MRSRSLLQRKDNIHFCCKCGKGMAYEEKSMVYLYKVEKTVSYYWPRGSGQRLTHVKTTPKTQKAYNLCDECAKKFSELLDGFLGGQNGSKAD